jgi:hypothetical protein
MSAWLVSLMVSVGASTWLYTKLQKNSGNNTQRSLIASAIAGVIFFIIMLSILSLIL